MILVTLYYVIIMCTVIILLLELILFISIFIIMILIIIITILMTVVDVVWTPNKDLGCLAWHFVHQIALQVPYVPCREAVIVTLLSMTIDGTQWRPPCWHPYFTNAESTTCKRCVSCLSSHSQSRNGNAHVESCF